MQNFRTGGFIHSFQAEKKQTPESTRLVNTEPRRPNQAPKTNTPVVCIQAGRAPPTPGPSHPPPPTPKAGVLLRSSGCHGYTFLPFRLFTVRRGGWTLPPGGGEPLLQLKYELFYFYLILLFFFLSGKPNIAALAGITSGFNSD